MSRICEICGKQPQVGYNVSHAHNKTKTRWNPNLHRVRTQVKGTNKRMVVCTRCIRAGLVAKPG